MKNLKLRLAILNFLEFAVWGSYLVSMGMYLGSAGLGDKIFWFYTVQGLVSLFMPALVGIIADKWVPAQKMLSVCQLLAGGFMVLAGWYCHTSGDAVSFADHKHYHSNKRSYHFIRRTSDRICKEHGLSVIVPGQDRGKSYIEHQAERTGTSYKAKLRAAIDRLLPGCHDLEELLVRLQREGYELKRGKYISARAPGQERFTRLKTLGADYAEDALTARMAGRARPSRPPKQRGGRVSLLIDIQNNIKAQQSAGYRHWATIENLKRIAETSNFLTEHGIGSMEELTERCEAASASAARLKAELRETGARIEELTLKMKHVAAYRQLKPIYDRYQASKDKEKFLRGYEREIILFEAAARECKRLGAVPLPSAARMQAEMDALTARRAALTAERQKARREEQDYTAVRRNVEEFLSPPRQAPARQKDMELE
mgnify:CR=1 FL=1